MFTIIKKKSNHITFGEPSLAMPTSFVAIPFTLPSSWNKTLIKGHEGQGAALFTALMMAIIGCIERPILSIPVVDPSIF